VRKRKGDKLLFTNKERRLVGEPYFTIIREDDRFIEFMSKNTKHCWIVFKKSSDSNRPVTIYHKHHQKDKYYHKHYETWTVFKAVESIKGHDDYVMSGGNY